MKLTTAATHYFTATRRRTGVLAVLALALGLPLVTAYAATPALDLSKLPPATTDSVDFSKDIQPLLANHCVKCHGPEKQKGELRLDGKAAALKGGDSGKVILPGKSADSPLVHFVSGLDPEKIMPPKGERLTARQIGL
ncbi:MAG: hypothetical protein EXS29_04890, partial [Pedosphaera sp.]|nr:hypothetical protein [Pedosphaera sp.]